MIPRPRPEVARLAPAEHGGRLALPPPAQAVLDFSTTVHAYGPPPGVREAVRTCNVEEYPDPRATPFCAAVAERLGLPPGWVMAGAGSLDLLRCIALAYVRPRDPVLLAGPTFAEYRVAAEVMGGVIHEARVQGPGAAPPAADRLLEAARRLRPRVTFLCTPNNPTGTCWEAAAVRALLRACAPGLLVVDEAFRTFVEAPWEPLPLLEEGPLLLVRSLTKDHALAGLRIGYAIGPPDLLAPLRQVQAPWQVSAPAQAAGVAALEDLEYLPRVMAAVRRDVRELTAALRATGQAPVTGAAHFFLLPVEDGRRTVENLRARGILVRSCASFGLPQYVRVGPRRPPENAAFVRAVGALPVEAPAS
jgi:histidinol-phosphate/aromatic aminotransferase/cobyric acid decarboxylase-like protein